MKPERIYAFFLKLYPKNYEQEFGEEMQYVFSESLKDTYLEERGIVQFWKRIATDIFKSLINQHIENMTRLLTAKRSDGGQEGGGNMKRKNNDLIMQNRAFGLVAGATAIILMLPLIAMRFDTSVDWTAFDFMIMGTLLFGSGSLFIIIARLLPIKFRMLLGVGFLLAVLVIWVHLAVGIVDTWPFAGS